MRIEHPFFALFFTLIFSSLVFAQGVSKITIESLKKEHEKLELNEDGEVIPLNIQEINKKIRFFIEEEFPNVELTRNIIWDSYTTFLSPSNRYHYHVFIAQVKVHKVINGEKDQIIVRTKQDIERLKYLEVIYNPALQKVSSNFKWFSEDEEFFPVEKENKTKEPDLESLGIANQENKATKDDFNVEHDGFEEDPITLEIVPKNESEIKRKIREFVRSKYSNVEYARNIIWDNYNTFISPFDIFHYHTFVVQAKVKSTKRLKYLEVLYNPVAANVTSDFIWGEEDEEFYRENPEDNNLTE